MSKIVTIVSVLIAVASLSLLAAEKHSGHSPQMSHEAAPSLGNQPSEGGQAQFSAIIEIVSLLEKNEETDWNSVDIDGLRSHLLDMDRLLQDTDATTTIVSDMQIQFTVTGTTTSIPSIHRMAAAHAKFIEQSRGWVISSELNEKGAIIIITVEEPATMTRLKALGFYGFMSLDSHHQAHHYQMAMGKSH
jgi:hypothetical protein